MAENQTLRIMLLGKTGSGKSSLGNVILGEEYNKGSFETGCAAVSVTKECKSVEKEINGKKIQLIDTPGFFDTKESNRKTKANILKGLKTCAPGPHAFLLVFKVERFTIQEQEVVVKMLKYFSEEALKYTTVVFTHGDQLQKRKIKDWVSESEALKNLVQKCGGRLHVFDNRYWNDSQDQDRNNQCHVTELLKTIHQTVRENGGGYYTNSFWRQIKNIEVLDIPLHVLIGLMLGGLACGAVGAGVAAAVGISKAGVLAAGVISGVGGASSGVGAIMALDPEAAEDVREMASDALKKLGIEDKSKQE